MRTGIVNLYQYFGFVPPMGSNAELSYWIPESLFAGRRRPAVLILPGGGYEHISGREAEPVALRFAAAGYAAFILKYAIAPACFPVQLQEAAMAMRYIRENTDALALAPGKVAAIGFSAGGHLCGCLGTMYDAPELAAIALPEIIRPDILGLCYPVTVSWGKTHEGTFENVSGGSQALRQRLSLEKQVRPDMPPVFLWHTREDASVPCRNSLLFASALEQKGIPFSVHIYHRGIHGLSLANELVYAAGDMPAVSGDVPSWVETMQAFFREFGFK